MTEPDHVSLGEALRASRIAAGHTQNSLASASGVSTRAISYLETGQVRRARRSTLEALLGVLDLRADARAALLNHGWPQPGQVPSGRAPSQLPPAVPAIAGRGDDLARAVAGLGSGGTVAVCGMPGIGKTAFAVQAATQARERFPGGQLFVDLQGTCEQPLRPLQALGFMLRSLLEPGTSLPAATDERSALLRATLAGRRVLVVLDNAYDEAQVRPLLPAGPASAALVTSRRFLAGLDVTHRVSLDVLRDPDAVGLLAQLASPARAGGDPDATAGLLRWCGGLPLAIRIVAARLVARPARPVAALARRLASESRRLDELSVGDLSVRAAFDPSYRMLGTRERQVLGRLALLQGAEGNVPLAALLLGQPAEETELLLEELAHTSLLHPLGTRDGFRLHGLVRLYAAEKATSLDPDARRVLAAPRIPRLSPAPDSNTA